MQILDILKSYKATQFGKLGWNEVKYLAWYLWTTET